MTENQLPAPVAASLDWQEIHQRRSDEDPHTEVVGWEANTGFGSWYCIEQYFGSDSYGWVVRLDGEVVADKDDTEDAKAAAQADFEARIRVALSHPAALSGGDTGMVLSAYEAKKICERLEFDASWDKCGSGYYSLKRQIVALATAPKGSEKHQ